MTDLVRSYRLSHNSFISSANVPSANLTFLVEHVCLFAFCLSRKAAAVAVN